MARRLTDEEIVSALIECGTIKAAAEMLGVQIKTLYSRMKQEHFKELYARAKSDLLKAATAKMQRNLVDACEVIAEIMKDADTAQQIRLNAADCIIRNTLKMLEQTDIMERVEELEAIIKERSDIL
ncbi:helix-turn-helix domain-containing protein [Butyrivibrio sp. AC2005]|uniref:helix-turn-helix domain-containing protein n=1 Tax=Butyrivibrio sp. AC2005 TaxID=1280672 RepID=UPI00047BCD26|nr:helix-turn-helix domain-containing protein [Butyrivibrio sp. AC2005]